MTKDQLQLYQDTEILRDIIRQLKGRKYKLDCGHHLTFGEYLGSDITIRNGANPEITCSECGY